METGLVLKDDALTAAVRRRTAELSLKYQDSRQLLHTDQLAAYLEQHVEQFGQNDGVGEGDRKLARMAALFYPIGIQMDATHPGTALGGVIPQLMAEQHASDYSPLVQGVLSEVYQEAPQHIASKLLMDALIGTHCNDEPHRWADIRQLELDLQQGPHDRLQQAQVRIQELLNLRFHTTAGRAYWQEKVAQAILTHKKKLEKLSRGMPEEVDQAPFASLEPQLPVRGAQTYFRAVYRNHINLSAIADNKANIMISVNSILISVLITFLSYRNIAETQPAVLLPVVIFLVTGMASLIFAVLSARPKVTNINAESEHQPTSGLAFFGSFVHLDRDAFTEAVDNMFQSSNQLYTNMVQDLYQLGKVLDKKYRYLSIAYNIFMVGLIVTVVLFLFTLFAF